MKILITGSVASQSSPAYHKKTTTFAGLVVEKLSKMGHEVEWRAPSINEDTSKYDKILVGLENPLFVRSNHSYAALELVGSTWGDSRLALLIDSPTPQKLTKGLESIAKNPTSITNSFFKHRPNFDQLLDVKTRVKILKACEALNSDVWPDTLAPAFPWTSPMQYEDALPSGAHKKIVLTNLDRGLLRINRDESTLNDTRDARWMAEVGASMRWLRGLDLSNPVVALRNNHRVNLHNYYSSRLHASMGFLHSPTPAGDVWWTPKVAMALAQNTAVFSEWRDTRILGRYWSIRPSEYEEMTHEEQRELSQMQFETYLNSIPNSGQVSDQLTKILGMEENDNE